MSPLLIVRWPWLEARITPEEKQRRFICWTAQQLKLLEEKEWNETSGDELELEAGRSADPAFEEAISRWIVDAAERHRKLLRAEPLIDAMDKSKDWSAFVRLTRDPDIAFQIAQRLMPRRGRKKGEAKKGQRQFNSVEISALQFMSESVDAIRGIWRANKIGRRRDDGLPSAEEVVIELLPPPTSRYNSPIDFDAVKQQRLADLINFRKSKRRRT